MKVRIATRTEVRERDKRITSEKRMLTRELQRSRVLVVETGFRSEGLAKPFRNWRGVVERCALGSDSRNLGSMCRRIIRVFGTLNRPSPALKERHRADLARSRKSDKAKAEELV